MSMTAPLALAGQIDAANLTRPYAQLEAEVRGAVDRVPTGRTCAPGAVPEVSGCQDGAQAFAAKGGR